MPSKSQSESETRVVSSPPPLSLVEVRTPEEVIAAHKIRVAKKRASPEVPTYPSIPYDVGKDLFTDCSSNADVESGLKRVSPVQRGRWWGEPCYKHTAHMILDAFHGKLYTRQMQPMAPGAIFDDEQLQEIVERSSKQDWPDTHQFLHLLRIFQDPSAKSANVSEKFLSTSLLLDVIVEGRSYEERRKWMEDQFPQLGIRDVPRGFCTHLVPRIPEADWPELWAALHLVNQGWERPCYGGIVCKFGPGVYSHQKTNSEQECMHWMMHPFISNT